MREHGKAKKADLSGHFAGEQHDAVAPLARFLVNARQISEIEEGRALGNDGTVAIPARSQDTEAFPPVMQRAQGNGHNGNGHEGNGHSGNNGHGGNGVTPTASLSPDTMEPQPESDLFGDPMSPEPMTPEVQVGAETAMDIAPVSSGDTVHDTGLAPEPELAPAQAELAASPEPEMQPLSLDATEPGMSMDMSAADTVFDTKLEPEAAPEAAPDTVFEPAPSTASTGSGQAKPKPDTDIKTRVMTPRNAKGRAQELTPEDLRIETGSLQSLNAEDEETALADKEEEPEKITTKVEQKTPPPAQPGTVVRDTVNFYNQTMALRDLLESNQRPAPNAPLIATQKLPSPLDEPGAPIATHRIPPPPQMPKPRPSSTPAIEPLQAESEALAPSAEPEPDSHDAQTRAFMAADLSPALSDSEAPSPELDSDSTATREARALPEPAMPMSEAPELGASDDYEEADRKDTDRFNLADLRPADLPPPEGTDKIEKSEFDANEDEPVRVSDEDTAARRDTQRFFVSDLVGIASFKPAPKPVPLSDEGEERDFTSSGSTTGMEAALDKTSSGTEVEPKSARPLPAPVEVKADFEKPPVSSGTRIIPEYGAPAPVSGPATPQRTKSGRLRSSDSQAAEKITEKVKPTAAPVNADTDKVPALGTGEDETPAESPVKKITDALTRRLRQERDETRKLIEEAEGVLLRLRQTPVSARQPKVPEPQVAAALPAHVDDSEPQPSAEPEEAFAGLPPLEDIASATIHDLRLAEELLEASKAMGQGRRKSGSGRQAAVSGTPAPVAPSLRQAISARVEKTASGRQEPLPDDPLLRIEQRLGGAAHSLDEILNTTSAALAKVTGELTRDEFEERKRARESARKPLSLGRALSGRSAALREADVALAEDEDTPFTEPAPASQSRRTPSGRSILEDEPVSRRTSARLSANSLSDDLGKLLSEAARSTRIHNAPKADNIPAKEPGLEFTEGPLWQSLLGIAGVTAFLAALFIWVWFMIASRGA